MNLDWPLIGNHRVDADGDGMSACLFKDVKAEGLSCGVVITQEMEQEEKQLMEEGERKEKEMMEKVGDLEWRSC